MLKVRGFEDADKTGCVCGGGNAELRVEMGRWNGLQRKERIYKQCTRERGGRGALCFTM